MEHRDPELIEIVEHTADGTRRLTTSRRAPLMYVLEMIGLLLIGVTVLSMAAILIMSIMHAAKPGSVDWLIGVDTILAAAVHGVAQVIGMVLTVFVYVLPSMFT